MPTYSVSTSERLVVVEALNEDAARLLGTFFLMISFPDIATKHPTPTVHVALAVYDDVKSYQVLGRRLILKPSDVEEVHRAVMPPGAVDTPLGKILWERSETKL